RLALQPLQRAVLEVARGDVVDDRVAGDRRPGLLEGGMPYLSPDDHTQLGLPVDLVGAGGHLDRVAGADQRAGELGEQGGVFGQVAAHLQDVRGVVEPHAEHLLRVRHEGGVVEAAELVAGPVGGGGRGLPAIAAQERAEIGCTQFDRAVLVDPDGLRAGTGTGDGTGAGADGGELHRGPSSEMSVPVSVRASPRASYTGSSEKRKASSPSSVLSCSGAHDGTANMSPTATSWRCPPTVTMPAPSNTCHTDDPTTLVAAVRAPGRSRCISQRIVDRQSPPVAGLV